VHGVDSLGGGFYSKAVLPYSKAPSRTESFTCEQWRNFHLKSGGTKFEAPKAPRIETPEASRGVGV